jgi:aminopeptidase-like protein
VEDLVNPTAIGDARELYRLCERLYPIGRSITGAGVRATLSLLAEQIALEIHEVPSGTRVFDWEVPPEWNLRAAYVESPAGERIIDCARHNLHVVGYSEPIDTVVSRAELERHLFSLPGQPDLIPYRTSYYEKTWGFCVQDTLRRQLRDGDYRVRIDATLDAGVMNYGELFLPGSSDREILVSTHICHPSLANDNLSGIAVATHLAARFASAGARRYGLRFVFVPGTIGAITWLARNPSHLPRIAAGLVLSGIGDRGPFTYKRSRHGAGLMDRLFERHLADYAGSTLRAFIPYGYDERQYCSPGIGIAAGCLMRTPYAEYPEYHTSGDDLDFITGASLAESFELCARVLDDAQRVARYRNLNPNCEPQLGRRGLYDSIGGDNDAKQLQLAMLWVLNYSDGDHSTLDIAHRSGLPLAVLERAVELLEDARLLEPVDGLP